MTHQPPVAAGILRAVLALTDFSPPAAQALARASLLAQAASLAHEASLAHAASLPRGATVPLHLLHVVPAAPLRQLCQALPGEPWLGRRIVQEAAGRLRREAASLQALEGLGVEPACVEGDLPEKAIATAERLDASLVVLGTRGAGFPRPLALGSTAERLLRRARRPLLLVREPAGTAYRRVLVALDFSPGSAALLALARCIAPQAQLLLCHAWQVPFADKLHVAGVDAGTIELYRQQSRAEATRRVQALAAAAGLPPQAWQACITEGDAALRLVEQERLHGCDLVVLGRQGQSAAEDLQLGATTQHVLADGRCDVLVSTARGDG